LGATRARYDSRSNNQTMGQGEKDPNQVEDPNKSRLGTSMLMRPSPDGPHRSRVLGPICRTAPRPHYIYPPLMAFPVILTICSLSPHRNQHARNYRCKGFLGSHSNRLLHCHRVRSSSSHAPLHSEPGLPLRRLSGVVAFQACIYFRLYPNDRPVNKVMVRHCHL
jgi:hypothetical protein